MALFNRARTRVDQLGCYGELPPVDFNATSESIANAEHLADFAQIEIRHPKPE